MDIKDFVNQMQVATKKIEDAKAEATKLALDTFNGQVTTLFEMYPQVQSVTWRQYTPYFNDGDTCEFSAYIDEFDTVVLDNNGEEVENEYVAPGKYRDAVETGLDSFVDPYATYKGGQYESAVVQITDEHKFLVLLQKMLVAMGDDIMLNTFGDHVQVKVSRAGVNVDEYDHD